jgi:hypothetical protein
LPTLSLAAFYLDERPADRALDGGFSPTPRASRSLELRTNVVGPVPILPGLEYRLSFNWLGASRGAYVIGPNQSATAEQPSAELNPIDQEQIYLGLSYRFGDNP